MFVVLESIDGGGKGRQREEISAYLLENSNINLVGEEFPVHNAFYEVLVHPALQEQTTMNSASWVLSYLLDKTLQADRIEPHVGTKDSLFFADGYFTTTIAYQSLLMKQVELEKLIQYSVDFKIPKPDFAIYIDVDPELALSWKQKEEGHEEGLDMFEKSIEKQKKLREIFTKMAKENIYCEWEIVDGNADIPTVTGRILEVFKKRGLL